MRRLSLFGTADIIFLYFCVGIFPGRTTHYRIKASRAERFYLLVRPFFDPSAYWSREILSPCEYRVHLLFDTNQDRRRVLPPSSAQRNEARPGSSRSVAPRFVRSVQLAVVPSGSIRRAIRFLVLSIPDVSRKIVLARESAKSYNLHVVNCPCCFCLSFIVSCFYSLSAISGTACERASTPAWSAFDDDGEPSIGPLHQRTSHHSPVSIIPMPRPELRPGIAWVNSMFGFIFVFGSMNDEPKYFARTCRVLFASGKIISIRQFLTAAMILSSRSCPDIFLSQGFCCHRDERKECLGRFSGFAKNSAWLI